MKSNLTAHFSPSFIRNGSDFVGRGMGVLQTILCGLLMAFSSLAASAKGNSFSVVFWESPEEELEFFYTLPGSQKLVPLEIYEMERSNVHSVSAAQINIYSKGKEGGKKIATVDLNSAYKASLIILKSLEKAEGEIEKKGGYEAIVLKDSPKRPPFGSYLFHNLSEMNVVGKLGETELDLPAKANQMVKPKAKAREALGLELWHTPEEEKVILQRNTFAYNPNKYLIIFLYSEKSASGKVGLKSKGINLLRGSEEK